MNEEILKRWRRLTQKEPKGNYEALHNTAFVKDDEVWLRGIGGWGKDLTLKDYCTLECKARCNNDYSDIPVDEFAELMDCQCPVALLYLIAVGAAEMREKLMRYEDKEESGNG